MCKYIFLYGDFFLGWGDWFFFIRVKREKRIDVGLIKDINKVVIIVRILFIDINLLLN